ncbi:MAG TPA: YraN family protein [Candidatus Dormibacteraeota bacterium]|nr:YraN family protein [Candidatus Dormibacteraeota bacterium]
MTNTAKGKTAEMHAEELLSSRGYRVIERNARMPGAEIDLVCVDGKTLVFVEVKRRDGTRFGSALSAVDARKRARLRAAAADYAQILAPRARVRFDVVAVDGDRTTLHRDVF